MLTQPNQPTQSLTPEYREILLEAVKAAIVHSKLDTTQNDRLYALDKIMLLVLELEDNDPIWLAALNDNH